MKAEKKGKQIAVVLSGSGYLDGSEIREAVGVYWALSRHTDIEVESFAPDIPQHDVVDHLHVQPVDESRNVLLESARIARGDIRPLTELDPSEFIAIVMPGGFGAAKNLSTFAYEGAGGSVTPGLAKIIDSFRDSGKPIGAACIAPAVLALAERGSPIELTVGAAGDESRAIESLGHRHFVTKPDEIHIDRPNKIVTTPAYMYGTAPLHEIFEGIRKMVDEVVALSR